MTALDPTQLGGACLEVVAVKEACKALRFVLQNSFIYQDVLRLNIPKPLEHNFIHILVGCRLQFLSSGTCASMHFTDDPNFASQIVESVLCEIRNRAAMSFF